MMTKEETILRAKQAIREGRVIEAGFIAAMLPNAPDTLSEPALKMVRLAFFHGAMCMMQTLNKVSEQSETVIDGMMNQLQFELTTFFRDDKNTNKTTVKH